MRKTLIAGNWKMNAGPTEAKVLADEMVAKWEGKEFSQEALICPPFVSLPFVVKSFRDTFFKAGAQNVYTENNGAYTGEISVSMLKELTCEYVILGHSERREYFNETDDFIAKKVRKVLNEGMKPILCVGEKFDQRQQGDQKAVVQKQLSNILSLVNESHAENFVVAYEPVWAIGTGETATPEQAQEMHQFIRSFISNKWSDEAADKVRILYGGSMKPANAEELLSQNDVDGGLIGGASLKADSFSEIMSIAEKLSKN
ncbi:triose-phosphate isomerase [Rhodohalobacter halophilus]|uniref:triose-phosphate isomerase n=1 Tax=Rhodohalobacter halophilus TaxID=1812810 RepID=UPI00083FC595|nr:triose-phosphate isomerase [Rhodohalobacter halophilus]